MKKTRRDSCNGGGLPNGEVFVIPHGPDPRFALDERHQAFAAIRGRDIPEDVIDLVEDFRGAEPLPWHLSETPAGKPQNTASDILACHLTRHAKLLGDGRGGLVRGRGMLARSDISSIAMLLLREAESAPSSHVVTLIECLLSLAPTDERQRRQSAWAAAAAILAQDPNVTVRDVADLVGVAPGTISTWRKEKRFLEEVERLRFDLGVMPGATKLYRSIKRGITD